MQYPPNSNNQPPFQSYQPGTYPPDRSGQIQGPQPPFQQPMQPPKKKSKLPLILGIIGGILVLSCIGVVAITATFARNTNTGTLTTIPTAQSNNSSTSNQSPQQHFKAGDVVKVGDIWNITINSVKTSNGSQFYTPKSGYKFLILNITAKNISNQEQNISSIVQFTLTDTTGQKYNQTINPNTDATLDGKVEASTQLKGSITWEVPTNIHSYLLAFESDIISSGQTIWDLQT